MMSIFNVSRHGQHGFTLVELSSSLAFISVLLLSIAILTMQISGVYNKGFTIREVDQSGQMIASELQTTLRRSTSPETKFADVPNASIADGGRLCAAGIVYAWNYRDAIADSRPAVNRHFNTDGTSNNDVRFVKFSGPLDKYCIERSGGGWEPLPATGTTELLGAGNSNVTISKFMYDNHAPAGDTSQLIHSIEMIVGTSDTGLINGDGECAHSERKDDESCAVNYFSFTARSGNEESGGDS